MKVTLVTLFALIWVAHGKFSSLDQCVENVTLAIQNGSSFSCGDEQMMPQDDLSGGGPKWRFSSKHQKRLVFPKESKARTKSLIEMLGTHVSVSRRGLDLTGGALLFLLFGLDQLLEGSRYHATANDAPMIALTGSQMEEISRRALSMLRLEQARPLFELLVNRSKLVMPVTFNTDVGTPMEALSWPGGARSSVAASRTLPSLSSMITGTATTRALSITVDGMAQTLTLQPGDDLHTVAASFCRRVGVNVAECADIEPWLRLQTIDNETPEGTAMTTLPRGPVSIATPLKGEIFAPGVQALVTLKERQPGSPSFCCIYLDDDLESTWCGSPDAELQASEALDLDTNGTIGAAAGKGLALARAAGSYAVGWLPPATKVAPATAEQGQDQQGNTTRLLLLTCRPSRTELESALSNAAFLEPDDAAFFVYTGAKSVPVSRA